MWRHSFPKLHRSFLRIPIVYGYRDHYGYRVVTDVDDDTPATTRFWSRSCQWVPNTSFLPRFQYKVFFHVETLVTKDLKHVFKYYIWPLNVSIWINGHPNFDVLRDVLPSFVHVIYRNCDGLIEAFAKKKNNIIWIHNDVHYFCQNWT